jgi:hypothetical protein
VEEVEEAVEAVEADQLNLRQHHQQRPPREMEN